jgi:MFS family permease
MAVLAALGVGVFLAGLELMVTAVALPSIVTDLADWTQLRHASWIVNAYLVAYVAMMPLAGRLADRYGIVRPFTISLLAFAAGSAAAGAAQSLDQLIAARVLEGLGAGAIVPLATAGASHLYEGPARARALGIIGALTFLGMAAGPFAGAAILGLLNTRAPLEAAGLANGPLVDLLAPAWRWVFYFDVPLALLALVYLWAAGPGLEPPRGPAALRVPGLVLFTAGLATTLLAITWTGSSDAPGGSAGIAAMLAAGVLCLAAAFWLGARQRDPLLDPRVYADPVYGGAVSVSALTGYALATALIGGAVFVDRVLYGGSPEQRVALGALAAAMAVGALVSGFALHRIGIVPISLAGIGLGAGGMALLGGTTPATPLASLALFLALFGLGFGLTVSPRSTAAVEALGQSAYGVASAAVTVARMLGMAVGLAVLTTFGSGRIEALSRVLDDARYRDSILPAVLRGRPLNDGLVVDALERWAAGQGAGILAGLFLVAGAIMVIAVLPALAMRRRHGGARVASVDAPGTDADHASGGSDADAAIAI